MDIPTHCGSEVAYNLRGARKPGLTAQGPTMCYDLLPSDAGPQNAIFLAADAASLAMSVASTVGASRGEEPTGALATGEAFPYTSSGA